MQSEHQLERPCVTRKSPASAISAATPSTIGISARQSSPKARATTSNASQGTAPDDQPRSEQTSTQQAPTEQPPTEQASDTQEPAERQHG